MRARARSRSCCAASCRGPRPPRARWAGSRLTSACKSWPWRSRGRTPCSDGAPTSPSTTACGSIPSSGRAPTRSRAARPRSRRTSSASGCSGCRKARRGPMDFGFNADQEMLRATARKFLENECTSEFVRARMAEDPGFTPEFWTKLAEQGWLGLVYPEAYGGAGLGFVDLTVLMEEMGRAVMPGPFFSTLLGGLAILEAGSDAQKKEWLTKIGGGEARVTLAWTEPNGRWDAAGVTTTAKASGGGVTLSGTKLFLPDAHVAQALVVVARTREGKNPEEGVSLSGV